MAFPSRKATIAFVRPSIPIPKMLYLLSAEAPASTGAAMCCGNSDRESSVPDGSVPDNSGRGEVCGGLAPVRRLSSKQERHSTGRPWVGRKGTVVSCPQTEHCVRVSARTLDPPPRFSLQALHLLGSLWNCLSRKKSCSPAVKMNSLPQSAHMSDLSWNSMTRSAPGPCPAGSATPASSINRTYLGPGHRSGFDATKTALQGRD